MFMAYLDGFVIAVPTANKDRFIAHANTGDSVFIDCGATRVVECWGADVPRGKTTDFHSAVAGMDDETIVFSWIEWPDKATRDAGMARMMAPDFEDPRMDPKANPMPFDGKRMIYGGFQPIVERGEQAEREYVQGFVIPVPEGKRETYRKMAEDAWEMFQGYGALRVVEAWGDDVPAGKQTDFYRAVKAEPGEKIVFSYMTWPSREICDAAAKKMQNDPEMKMPDDMPFDPKRMIVAGFEPIVDLKKKRA
jgi:uncharacterized protein YbaA (DUF1428 family)